MEPLAITKICDKIYLNLVYSFYKQTRIGKYTKLIND
jgi:hypothetical protein